jgi:hypothetical protein
MLRQSLVIVALCVSFTFAGCGGDDGPGDEATPTRAEAADFLTDFYELAQTKDSSRFCGDDRVFSAEMCHRHWVSTGGPESVPTQPPRVLDERPEAELLTLRVCGTDGLGRPYQGDFVVERFDGQLTIPLPVFWEGIDYSGTYPEDDPPVAGARGEPKERVGCP